MSLSIASRIVVTTTLLAIGPVLADSNDWVNVEYTIKQSEQQLSSSSSTTNAQDTIIRNADSSFLNGPWSVTHSRNATPPSGDPHDYMSWAPYHWPNCNWCSSAGRIDLAHPGDGANNTSSNSRIDGHPNPGSKSDREDNAKFKGDDIEKAPSRRLPDPSTHRRQMKKWRHQPFDADTLGDVVEGIVPLQAPITGPSLPPGNIVSSPAAPVPISHTTATLAKGTPMAAQAATKTRKTTCTPSPTQDVAPSATWTTCPYIVRDGQANPDVRTLNGPGAISSVSQTVLYNAIAYALQTSARHSRNVAQLIDAFFLDPETRMNPNMNYGQIVRGPGPKGRSGTFTGILDLRGLVKIVNAVQLMKSSRSPDWTSAREQVMGAWMSQYATWLTGSELGKSAGSRPNNHGSSYVSQVAAAKILAGDNSGAAGALQEYFTSEFIDQIAKSGEQPFEAVRTRPYHYRCFNLEAMLTNAKLGDQLGLNLWTAKSKYGATIQTAADFIMFIDPKNEDANELVPHIASVAAAYGDPTGKYANFLKKTMPNYQDKPFWFYDQTVALPNSPAARINRRSMTWAKDDTPPGVGNVPFECPRVFQVFPDIEIDNGVFVTCEMLRPFYEVPILS